MAVTETAPTETEWQAQVVQLAHLLGWRHMHCRRSIGKGRQWVTATNVAWPDLTLWNEAQRRVLFVELKTDTGKVTGEQAGVLASLEAAGAETFVWRPRDLDDVQRALGARP